MALPEIQIEPKPTDTPVEVNGRWAGYWALLGARMKELWREPEVIFWVFVFPLLLALGLGIAFRNKPADITPVAVVNNSNAQTCYRFAATLAGEERNSRRHARRKDGARPLPSRPVFPGRDL